MRCEFYAIRAAATIRKPRKEGGEVAGNYGRGEKADPSPLSPAENAGARFGMTIDIGFARGKQIPSLYEAPGRKRRAPPPPAKTPELDSYPSAEGRAGAPGRFGMTTDI